MKKEIAIMGLASVLTLGACAGNINLVMASDFASAIGNVGDVDSSNKHTTSNSSTTQTKPITNGNNISYDASGLGGASISEDYRKNLPQSTSTPFYEKNNFLEMRRELEDLFGVINTSTVKSGPLLMASSDSVYNGYREFVNIDRANYKNTVGLNAVTDVLKVTGTEAKLKALASKSFTDVKGTEWYSKDIPLAVYFGVINGYPDGTFKGGNNVSRAEACSMFDNFARVEKTGTGIAKFKSKWYSENIGLYSITGFNYEYLSIAQAESHMTRGEVALLLVKEYYSADYWKYMRTDNLTSKFKDIKKVEKSSFEKAGDIEIETQKSINELFKSFTDPTSANKEVVSALNVLYDKGIMTGDSNGNSNWSKGVTRAEMITLFNRVANILGK